MDQARPSPVTEALVGSLQGGDADAFAALYERVLPSLYAWSALRAPRGVEAVDLVAETWLHAVRGLQTYEPARASFRAWIFGVAKKVLLQLLRDIERQPAPTPGEAVRAGRDDPEAIPDSVTSLSRRCACDEALALFLARVADLGELERELLIFCGLEGFSCGQAATRLGLSEEATTKRWQRLRAELRTRDWVADLLA